MQIFKFSSRLLILILITLGLSISFQSLLASWTSPTLAPPQGNAPAPINVSSTGQSKDGGLILNHLGSSGSNGLLIENGNVGIGTAGPDHKLQITGSTDLLKLENTDSATNQYAIMRIKAGTQTNSIWTNNQNSAGFYGGVGALNLYTGQASPIAFFTNAATTPQMIIASGGNVGIGTSNPSTAKLDIAGKIKVSDGSQGTGKVLTSDASGLASWTTLASAASLLTTANTWTQRQTFNGDIDKTTGGTFYIDSAGDAQIRIDSDDATDGIDDNRQFRINNGTNDTILALNEAGQLSAISSITTDGAVIANSFRDYTDSGYQLIPRGFA